MITNNSDDSFNKFAHILGYVRFSDDAYPKAAAVGGGSEISGSTSQLQLAVATTP